MAYPTNYVVTYSYTGFAQALGDGSFAGTQLDTDFADLAQTTTEIIAFLSGITRSDGALKNGIVTIDALEASVAAALGDVTSLATFQALVATATTQAGLAQAAATAAAGLLDSFDDRYLGAYASDPTTDNDGNALLNGALYSNTTTGLKVWNGVDWAGYSAAAEPVVSSASSITVASGTSALVLNGASPTATAIALPSVGSQPVELTIVDLSTSVTEHVITLTPNGSEKIMGASTFTITSTAFDKARITLAPSTTINGWYIR